MAYPSSATTFQRQPPLITEMKIHKALALSTLILISKKTLHPISKLIILISSKTLLCI